MKKILLNIIISMVVFPAQGQFKSLPGKNETVPIHFFSTGLLDSVPARVFKDQQFELNIDLPSTKSIDSFKLAFKKKLYQQLTLTIENFNTKQCKSFYNYLWGSEFCDELNLELADLKRYLKGEPTLKTCDEYTYTPSPCDVDVLLNSNPPLKYKKSYNDNTGAVEISLIAEDNYKQFLMKRFNQTFVSSALRGWQTDWDFKADWKALSGMQKRIKGYTDTLKYMDSVHKSGNIVSYKDDNFYVEHAIVPFKDSINRNQIFLDVRNDTFLKKWVWYNYGIFSINPFLDTVVVKKVQLKTDKKKGKEFDQIIAEKIVVAPFCCDTNINYIQNLIKAENTGNKRFTDTSDKAEIYFGWNIIDIQKSEKISNKVLMPATIKKQETKWMYNYYANKNYTKQKVKILVKKDNIPYKQGAFFCVQNVPSNIDIALKQRDSTFADKSAAQLQFDNLISNTDFGGLSTAFGTAASALAAFNVSLPPVNYLLKSDDEEPQRAGEKAFEFEIYNLYAILKRDSVILSYILKLSPDLPVEPLTIKLDTNADYRTVVNQINTYKYPNIVPYTLVEAKKVKLAAKPDKDTMIITPIVNGNYKIGNLYPFTLSAGVVFMPNNNSQKTVSASNNQVSVSQSSDVVGFIVGMNVYPFKLYNQDNSFLGLKNRMFWNRVSIFGGLGFPQPLQNYYAGVSLDVVPGVRFMGGCYLYKYTKYQLLNNQIEQQASALKAEGIFMSVAIDPVYFVKILALL